MWASLCPVVLICLLFPELSSKCEYTHKPVHWPVAEAGIVKMFVTLLLSRLFIKALVYCMSCLMYFERIGRFFCHAFSVRSKFYSISNTVTWFSDFRRVLDWWLDLLDSLIQCVTTLYSTLLHTKVSKVHVFTSRCLVAASKGGRSPSSGLPNWPRLLTATAQNDWTTAVL
jgi:hypothetical protein